MHEFDPTGAAIQSVGDELPGTLMWIGNRDRQEFSQAYDQCENSVSQLAHRRDLADAIRRPAAMVQRIIMTRTTRQPLDQDLVRQLTRAYPVASAIELLGPLCVGEAADDPETRPRFDARTIWQKDRFESAEKQLAHIDDFDAVAAEHYAARGLDGRNWSAGLWRKFQKPLREHLAGYYASKGASLD